MRLLVDGCVSPSLVHDLHRLGYDAVHPRDCGRLGGADRAIFALAIDEDRIAVLPSVTRDEARRLMGKLVAHLVLREDPRPAGLVVNAVLTIDEGGRIAVEPLP